MTTQIGRAMLRAALGPAVEGLEHRLLLTSFIDRGTWTVSVEDEPERGHRIVVELVGESSLRVTVDGTRSGVSPVSTIHAINIIGGPKDDVVVVAADVPLTVRIWADGSGGNDRLVSPRPASLFGGDGDDTLKGSALEETLSGGQGNDLVFGKGGADELFGGAGDDRLYGGAGDDELHGGDGDDQLFGGAGDDQLVGEHGQDQLAGAAGADTLHGNTGPDTLRGGGDGDVLDGGFDDDVVLGQRGADTLRGGLGADRMVGGADADTFRRERDSDWLRTEEQDAIEDDVFEEPLTRSDDAVALKGMLIDEAVKVWAERLGSASTPWTQWRLFSVSEDGKLVPSDEAPGGPGVCGQFSLGEWEPTGLCGGGGGTAGTNVQEQDVDEADLVKTDGRYVYVAREGELLVIDATRAGAPRLVHRTEIGGDVLGLYLRDERVTVLSQARREYGEPPCVYEVWFSAEAIEPGSVCDVVLRQPRELNVWVLDVSEPSEPSVIERTRLDGTLITSRVVDGTAHLVLHNSLDLPGPRRTWHEVPPPASDWNGTAPVPILDGNGEAVYGVNPVEWDGEDTLGQIKGYFLYETEAQYRARLESMSLAELVPGYETFAAKGTRLVQGGLVEAGRVHFSPRDRDEAMWYSHGRFWDMTSVVTMDLDDGTPGPAGSTSVAGFEPGTVYASSENFWLTRPRDVGGMKLRIFIASHCATMA